MTEPVRLYKVLTWYPGVCELHWADYEERPASFKRIPGTGTSSELPLVVTKKYQVETVAGGFSQTMRGAWDLFVEKRRVEVEALEGELKRARAKLEQAKYERTAAEGRAKESGSSG